MSGRPGADLTRLLDELGSTLLELVHAPASSVGATHGPISAALIHDPVDKERVIPNSLVLGVGVSGSDQIIELLHQLGEDRAAALVVRAPVVLDPRTRAAGDETGVALLAFTRGASWTQLSALLRALLAEGEVGGAEPDTLGGLPSGDLFAVANAIAALLDAPITIEDRNSRVLAFSGRQDEADSSRVETILGRQVPERYARLLSEQGVFRELYRTDQPVFIDPLPATGVTMSRAAIAVRAGDELLGSLWAAVHEPLSPEHHRAFCEAAKLVALHLLQQRAGSDVERRLRADLLGTALEGGAGARGALDRLGLGDQSMVVLALTIDDRAAPTGVIAGAELVGERQRLSDAFAMHLGAVHPSSAVAALSDVVYGLVPLPHQGERYAVGIATDFLDRIGGRGHHALIGVSPVAEDIAGLARARGAVDRVLRVLRERNGPRVAQLADVHVESLMLELRDLVVARGDQPTGPVARLLAYDAAHNTRLVETLRAWLDNFGDTVTAAASLYVHPNTFRYRLRRLAEIGEIDLEDSEARFAAMLQLRAVVSR